MADGPDIILSIACRRWNDDLPDADAVCRKAALAAFAATAEDATGVEIGIMLSDDEQVQTLNRDYRGQDKPTNVLSFAADEEPAPPGAPRLLGDVIIAYGVARTESENEGKTLADHLGHLVVHGVLHLVGHDHIEATDAERMEALEVSVLAGLGIDDPYGVSP
ncbi:MAG: rRNA maturation RNase YbeY [Alphaproteobacteria bacterium]